MTPALAYYTTNEVARSTGASLRQLQWWSEHKWVRPAIHGKHRRWIEADVEKVRKIVALRRAGVRHSEMRRLRLLEVDFAKVVVVKKATLIDGVLYVPRDRKVPTK